MTSEGAIAWLGAAPGETALFSDFDGTLSRIVARPEDAVPLPGVVTSLETLASRLAVVGVVSGRPVSFLVERLGLDGRQGVHAYGLHGVEHTLGDGVEVAPGAELWRGRLAAAISKARHLAPLGVEVEDKGLGVTYHWRNAPDWRQASDAAEAVTAEAVAAGLVARPGKASVELVPPLGVDKGTVVLGWGERPSVRRLAFLGDDSGDVLAFEAIDRLAAQRSGWAGLKVAVSGPEVPSRLIDTADVVLPGPEAAATMLADLARALGPDEHHGQV